MISLIVEGKLENQCVPWKRLAMSTWNRNALPFRVNSLPTISALKFNGALTMAVGTSTGQVTVYSFIIIG